MHVPRRLATALLLPPLGCGERAPEQAHHDPAPPPVTAPAGAAATFVDRDVCPFECCVYGEWRTTAPVPVFSAEGDTIAVAFAGAGRAGWLAMDTHGENVWGADACGGPEPA